MYNMTRHTGWVFNMPNFLDGVKVLAMSQIVKILRFRFHCLIPILPPIKCSMPEEIKGIRMGEQTKEDIELLRTRIRPKNHPDLKDALYIACTKISVNAHNNKCLNELSGKLYESKVKHFTKLRSNFKPHVQKDGSISDTGFQDVFKLKIGARVYGDLHHRCQ